MSSSPARLYIFEANPWAQTYSSQSSCHADPSFYLPHIEIAYMLSHARFFVFLSFRCFYLLYVWLFCILRWMYEWLTPTDFKKTIKLLNTKIAYVCKPWCEWLEMNYVFFAILLNTLIHWASSSSTCQDFMSVCSDSVTIITLVSCILFTVNEYHSHHQQCDS